MPPPRFRNHVHSGCWVSRKLPRPFSFSSLLMQAGVHPWDNWGSQTPRLSRAAWIMLQEGDPRECPYGTFQVANVCRGFDLLPVLCSVWPWHYCHTKICLFKARALVLLGLLLCLRGTRSLQFWISSFNCWWGCGQHLGLISVLTTDSFGAMFVAN